MLKAQEGMLAMMPMMMGQAGIDMDDMNDRMPGGLSMDADDMAELAGPGGGTWNPPTPEWSGVSGCSLPWSDVPECRNAPDRTRRARARGAALHVPGSGRLRSALGTSARNPSGSTR